MEFDKRAFANILKTLCDYYGSINKFADKSGVTAAYLSKLIRLQYENPPSPDILRRIAENSNKLFTYLELMYICGYFTKEEYDILREFKGEKRRKKMSRCSKKCNEIKQKIDSISGLDDDNVFEKLQLMEWAVNVIVTSIEEYADADELNGTCFKNTKSL